MAHKNKARLYARFTPSPKQSWVMPILVLLFVAIPACITISLYFSDDGEIKALESNGFKDIKMGGWAPMSCGNDDASSKSFTATNSAGKRVNGVVCCGWFKSCTVRF
jgi:hypothetical protein